MLTHNSTILYNAKFWQGKTLANLMSFCQHFTQQNPVKIFDVVVHKSFMLPHTGMVLLTFFQAMKKKFDLLDSVIKW